MMTRSTENQQKLTPEQGNELLLMARRTLKEHFSGSGTLVYDLNLDDDAFQRSCGTFVTLKIKNQLRGCIGNLSSSSSIVDGVRDNALNAAFHDPRFPPLDEDELPNVQIEVSVLTAPVELSYKDADDLLSVLKPDIDGVILRKGTASATFLPQVWEQLPRPEDFLSHLCMKAGLSARQWRQGNLAIEVYQVQYFEERV